MIERALVVLGVTGLHVAVVAIVFGFYAAMVEAERLGKIARLPAMDRIVAIETDLIR